MSDIEQTMKTAEEAAKEFYTYDGPSSRAFIKGFEQGDLVKQLEIDLLRDQNKALKAEIAKLKQMVEELQELNSILNRKQ